MQGPGFDLWHRKSQPASKQDLVLLSIPKGINFLRLSFHV